MRGAAKGPQVGRVGRGQRGTACGALRGARGRSHWVRGSGKTMSADEATAKAVVANEDGLHGRPSMEIARFARGYLNDIDLYCRGRVADAKDSWDVLLLGASRGSEVMVRARGSQSETVASEVASFIGDGLPRIEVFWALDRLTFGESGITTAPELAEALVHDWAWESTDSFSDMGNEKAIDALVAVITRYAERRVGEGIVCRGTNSYGQSHPKQGSEEGSSEPRFDSKCFTERLRSFLLPGRAQP